VRKILYLIDLIAANYHLFGCVGTVQGECAASSLGTMCNKQKVAAESIQGLTPHSIHYVEWSELSGFGV